MVTQTLNTKSESTNLAIANNVTTGDLLLGDNVTTGNIGIGRAMTGGEINIGTYSSRTGDINVGSFSCDTRVLGQILCPNKGTVTQTTDVNTGVTINNGQGTIHTVGLTIKKSETEEFTVTNSRCVATSIILCNVGYGGSGSVHCNIHTVTNGSFVIKLSNTGGMKLDEFASVQFVIL